MPRDYVTLFFLFFLFSEFYLYIVLPDKIVILIINNPQETREINIVFKNLEKIVSLFFSKYFTRRTLSEVKQNVFNTFATLTFFIIYR